MEAKRALRPSQRKTTYKVSLFPGDENFPTMSLIRKYSNWRCSSERGLDARGPFFLLQVSAICLLPSAGIQVQPRLNRALFSKDDGMGVYSPLT